MMAVAAAKDAESLALAKTQLDAGLRFLAEVDPAPKEVRKTGEVIGRMVLGMLVCPQCGYRPCDTARLPAGQRAGNAELAPRIVSVGPECEALARVVDVPK
jgi:hypothetical protein